MTVSPAAILARDVASGRLRLGLLDLFLPDETVILLTSPLPLVGVSIGMERGCHQSLGHLDLFPPEGEA